MSVEIQQNIEDIIMANPIFGLGDFPNNVKQQLKRFQTIYETIDFSEEEIDELVESLAFNEVDLKNYKRTFDILDDILDQTEKIDQRKSDAEDFIVELVVGLSEEMQTKIQTEEMQKRYQNMVDFYEQSADFLQMKSMEERLNPAIKQCKNLAEYYLNTTLGLQIKVLEGIKHVNKIHGEEGTADFIEALGYNLEEDIGHPIKRDYTVKILEKLCDGYWVSELSKFAYKMKELREIGFDVKTAGTKAEEYVDNLHDIRVSERLETEENNEVYERQEEIVEKTDRIYREQRLEELQKNNYWNTFYTAFTNAASGLSSEPDGLQSSLFMEKFGRQLKTNGQNTLQFVAERIGVENLVYFVSQNGKPKFNDKGNPVSPEEAYNVVKETQEEKPKKGLLSGLVGMFV